MQLHRFLMSNYENGKNASETIKPSEYDDILTEALLRAAEINRRLDSGRSGRGFTKTTIRQTCESFLAGKEASANCEAPTIKKYRAEL